MEHYMQDHYRQGDVLLVRVNNIPANVTPRPRDKGRVILAYGEVTGHAHQIDTPDTVALFNAPESEVDRTSGLELAYLKVDRLSQLVHEEHDAIMLEPGMYRVSNQREYAPEALRSVAD